jgi:hypothetical protein
MRSDLEQATPKGDSNRVGPIVGLKFMNAIAMVEANESIFLDANGTGLLL